ncbi:MAG: PqqD family protein [Ignavibacteriae bacterium]|nr:PqqD family protein [Ignavibacteriota bacterium]NOG99904.1 PqqD family protein [Ignavibacteriota bacterium]
MRDSNFLEYYPKRVCEFEVNDELVTVLFKKEKLTFVEKTFFKSRASKPHKIDLDEIGSFVWHLCDGKNSVNSIVEKGREHFGEKIEPAEDRLELFLTEMNKNRLIQIFKKVDTKNVIEN